MDEDVVEIQMDVMCIDVMGCFPKLVGVGLSGWKLSFWFLFRLSLSSWKAPSVESVPLLCPSPSWLCISCVLCNLSVDVCE